MAPENILLVTTEFQKDEKVANQIAKEIPEVKSAKTLGGYNLPERVLVTVYIKPQEKRRLSYYPKRFGEVYRQIKDMADVLGVESLGFSGYDYKKDKKGEVKKRFFNNP